MVRIGRWVIFERAASEKFKAAVDVSGGGAPKRKIFYPGQHSWRERCDYFAKLAEQYPLFNQSCLALAGMVMSQGVFFNAAVNKQDETYGLAEEARWRCEKLSRTFFVNSRFYETVMLMAKYGSCFWEVTFNPTFSLRLAPSQEYIEPAELNDIGTITRWRQNIKGSVVAEWPAEPSTDETYLVHVPWNPTSTTWPYGTSIGTGSETELEALVQMESNAKDYMEKQAWPYEVLQLGDGKEGAGILESDFTTARNEWKNRKPGEGIATRNMPVNIIPGGTGSSPIRELSVLCQLMKDNAHDGLMVAPISKLYNSTEASAKVLTAHIMTALGQPIQWILKEAYQESVLKPYLESAGFSHKNCPDVLFESPDVHKKEEGEYWVGLVGAKIQSPQQAAEHLGLEYDEEFWSREKQEEQEKMQQQIKDKEDNQFEEWVVRRRNRANR
jgi:hypothetical protein